MAQQSGPKSFPHSPHLGGEICKLTVAILLYMKVPVLKYLKSRLLKPRRRVPRHICFFLLSQTLIHTKLGCIVSKSILAKSISSNLNKPVNAGFWMVNQCFEIQHKFNLHFKYIVEIAMISQFLQKKYSIAKKNP